jgi:hypothetical protein
MCLIVSFVCLDSIMVTGHREEAASRLGGSLQGEPFGAAQKEVEARWKSFGFCRMDSRHGPRSQ